MRIEPDLELLSAYLDGALTDNERAVLEARLQSDAELRRELERLRATVALIGTLPSLTAPRDFTLARGTVRRQRLLTSAAFSAASAAAAVVLLVIGGLLFTRSADSGNLAPAADQVAFVATLPAANDGQVATLDELRDEATLESAANGVVDNLVLASPTSANAEIALTAPGESPFVSPNAVMRAAAPEESMESAPPAVLEYAAQATPTFGALVQSAPQTVATTETFDSFAPSAADSAGQAGAGQSEMENSSMTGAAESPILQAPSPQATVIPMMSAPSTATVIPPTAAPTLAPTNTRAVPTATVAPTTTPAPPPPADTGATQPRSIGIGLIVAAALLLGVAVVTTILRRR